MSNQQILTILLLDLAYLSYPAGDGDLCADRSVSPQGPARPALGLGGGVDPVRIRRTIRNHRFSRLSGLGKADRAWRRTMIRIENLVKHYGAVHALDGLSLNVEPGVVYGFLGPNGAGKTTTMRILSGLARADGGRAWILDNEIGQPGMDIRPLIGVLPEEPVFYPWMTAREYLRDFVARLYRMDAPTARKRTDELLSTVGLKEARNRRIGGFSRGNAATPRFSPGPHP